MSSQNLSSVTVLMLVIVAGGDLLPAPRAAAVQPATTVSVAQQTGTVLGEVVVTATRRAEPLAKVPLSVGVLSRDSIDLDDVASINDIAQQTPGLEVQDGGNDAVGRSQLISIRGISSNVGVPTTGVYLDDTPLPVNSFPALYDLDRVEVLRGPQGTLFGAGAEGGVVRFITVAPSLSRYSLYSKEQASYTDGGAPGYEWGAAGGGPIIDGALGFRLSASDRREGGWIDRVDPFNGIVQDPNSNSSEQSQFREAITWARGPFKITAAQFNARLHQDNPNQFWENLSDPPAHDFKSGRVLEQPSTDTLSLSSLNLTYDLPWANLVSTTSYLQHGYEATSDYSAFVGTLIFGDPLVYGPGKYSVAYLPDHEHDFQQEIRLVSTPTDHLSWTLGVYYDKTNDLATQRNDDPYLDSTFQDVIGVTVEQAFGVPLINGVTSFLQHTHTITEQKAAYGNITASVTRRLKLDLGVRVENSRLDYSQDASGPIAGPGGVFVAGSQSQTPVTPKFGVSYQLADSTMVYAYRAKGYRIGGVNAPLISLCNAELASLGLSGSQRTYDPDTVWSNEIGVKTRTSAFQVDVSAFDVLWYGVQRSIFLTSCGNGFTANLGTARSDGFDASVEWRAANGLLLGANFGYANARMVSSVEASPAAVYTRRG